MARYFFLVACLTVLSGCTSIPKDAFLLRPADQADRKLESRIFATKDERPLLNDGAAILRNMGYTTDLVNMDAGLVTASKSETANGALAMIMSVLSAGLASSDKEQIYRATFTALPDKGKSDAYVTRLTLQRMVIDSDGEATNVELIKDKDLYKLFYERLEASTFIEPDRL
ncbi:MAG: hypothetical protein P8164_07830 [Gammaproteobacteria bacterium]